MRLASEPVGMAGGELGEHDGVLGVAGHRAGEAVEAAVRRAGPYGRVLEDALADAAARLADGLDEIEVAVAAGGLLDDEHRSVLRIVYAEGKAIPCVPA